MNNFTKFWKCWSLLIAALFAFTTGASGQNVARIGSAEYATLQAAINEASAGAEITLLSDFTVSSSINIGKALTIDGAGHTITSSVSGAAVEVYGTGDVTISNTRITANSGRGVQVGDVAHYSGVLTFSDNSVVTVGKRGINVLDVDAGFALNVTNSVIQSNVADPTSSYTTGEESRGINFSNDPLAFNANVTNSEIRGFSYVINVFSGTQNLNLTMTGGKTYGRAAVNNWGDNNTFTLNGVEIHGLNNQTGPTESFACIVDNVDADGNAYNIAGCTFTASLSAAAMSVEGSSATEEMLALRGTNATVNITGATTYSCNSDDCGGLISSEQALSANSVTLDATSQSSLSDEIAELALVDMDSNGTLTYVSPVAAIGSTSYKTLQAAIDAATAGQTVTLLCDVDATDAMYTGDTRFNLWVNKSITIDGDGHELSVKGRGIGVAGASGGIDVTFENLTVKNVGNVNGRCIDTRGNLASLTLDNVVLTTDESTYTGYLQPLTIGGNQASTATVTITDSEIVTVDAANKGYAITTFNPVDMTITGSTIKGWACLNIKGPDSSAGSAGSTISVSDNSTLISANGTPGATNSYSLVKVEDDDVTVSITNTTINVNGADNTQSIVSFQKPNLTAATGSTVSLGEGNNVTLAGTYQFASNTDAENGTNLIVSGGTFNVEVPEEVCATGYIPEDNGDNTYGVRVGTYVAQIGSTKYESLAEAVAAVPADGTETTITMLADETITTNAGVTIAAGKNIVLDLNGKTVAQTAPDANVSYLIQNYGTLTIMDSSDTNEDGSGTGKMTAKAETGSSAYTYANNLISNRGKLTIESGYLENTTQSPAASYVVDNYSNGVTVINGGRLYNYYTSAIRQFCNSAMANNSVTVNGGIIEGYDPIWVQGASGTTKGDLTINGGTIKTTEKNVVNGTITIPEGNSYLYMYPSNDNMSLTITGGTLDTNVATWGNGSVSISGGTFNGYVYSATQEKFISGGIFIEPVDEEYAAEFYTPVDNGNGTYGVRLLEASERDYVFVDGDEGYEQYNIAADTQVQSATYRRSFDASRVDKYQAWFLPFDYTITDDDVDNFNYYKIHMIANAPEAGVMEESDQIWIYLKEMGAGEVLRANKPYVYMPKGTQDDYDFVTLTATLKAPLTTSPLSVETAENTFSFYGTYATTYITESDHFYYLNINGNLSYGASTSTYVGPYRWILRVTAKDGSSDYSRAIGFVNVDDVTGINSVRGDRLHGEAYYTLDGKRVSKPGKGVYVVRMADGTTKKVMFQ